MRPGRIMERLSQHRRAGIMAVATTLAVVAAMGVLMAAPTADGAVRLAVRLVGTTRTPPSHAPKAPPPTRGFRRPAPGQRGIPPVGALFTVSGGSLGQHFCTASVVDSPVRDLVITAAHCVGNLPPSQIAFVPGYQDGVAPYGIWFATRVIVSDAWRSTADPNDDVAFLVVQPGEGTRPVQDVTGGYRLGVGWPARQWVTVIGYPDDSGRPVTCQARTSAFGTSQMRFDCGGYTNGTSGGPFIAQTSRRATREGTIIGVIGGYEQGGNVPAVSYSARFGSAVASLYLAAVARG